MSEDLITKLRAALDTAEHLANEALEEAAGLTWEDFTDAIANRTTNCDLMCDFIASWDPARVLKLIARDRALLTDVDEAQRAMDRAVLGYGLGDVTDGELVAATARLKALREESKRAAEFWLGEDTPK